MRPLAVAALTQGEVDWLDRPTPDLLPLLARNADVTVEVKEAAGAIGIMRFNHLYPPFDNPAIRRALLGAVDQADVMMSWREPTVPVARPGRPVRSRLPPGQ